MRDMDEILKMEQINAKVMEDLKMEYENKETTGHSDVEQIRMYTVYPYYHHHVRNDYYGRA